MGRRILRGTTQIADRKGLPLESCNAGYTPRFARGSQPASGSAFPENLAANGFLSEGSVLTVKLFIAILFADIISIALKIKLVNGFDMIYPADSGKT